MARRLIATGVLGWGKYERQSKEYGFIGVEPSGYGEDAKSRITPFFDAELLESLRGKKVRLIAVVREARKSEHCGDMFLYLPGTTEHIKPTTPEVGQEIEIGVGYLQIKRDDEFINPMFGVNCSGYRNKGEDRSKFQMDPERLYKLHDQTVDVFIEETSDPNSPLTKLEWDRDGKRGRGVGDGFVQLNTVVGENDIVSAKPTITRHGGGLFSLSPPSTQPGASIEVRVRTSVKKWTIKFGNKYVGTAESSLNTDDNEVQVKLEGDNLPWQAIHAALQSHLQGDTDLNAKGELVVQVDGKKYRIKQGERPCKSKAKRKASTD